MHKTPAWTPFVHPCPSLFALFCFPGNSLLSCTVPMETEGPGICRSYNNREETQKPSNFCSFIILFFSGSKVTQLTLAYTCPRPPQSRYPSLTAVSDSRRLNSLSYSSSVSLSSIRPSPKYFRCSFWSSVLQPAPP